MKLNKTLSIALLSGLVLASGANAKSYKRGVSENKFQYKAQLEVVSPGVSWFYNWANTIGSYIVDQEYMEFVPMCWNGNFNEDNIRAYAKAHPNCKYLLGFNEPNFTAQANMTPQQAADKWPQLQALAKELDLKLVAPALNYSPNAPYQDPTKWMDEFVALVGKDAFDFVALHNYGGLGVMKDLCTRFHDRYGKPVWVTEFCYWPGESGGVPVASQIGSMVESVEWLEKTDWIYRYAWFKATEASAANYHLIEAGKGEDPRTLTEQGLVYVYMPEFDPEEYHAVNTEIPAVHYIDRVNATLGKGNNPKCEKPIEISSFSAGSSLDYQFDVPSAGDYTLVLSVTGIGEPTRFDPSVKVVKVNEDGTETELSPAKNFALPGNETDYKSVYFQLSLPAGKQTLRIVDANPYMPSGLRISTVKLADTAGVEDIITDEKDSIVNVYTLQGTVVRRAVDAESASDALPSGIYIIGNKKVIIK